MKSRDKIHAYWHNPDDGMNDPEDYLKRCCQQRTETLVAIIKRMPIAKDAQILELGCGVGRNLEALRKAGYTNLFGIDMNEKAIDLGEVHFPHLEGRLYYGSIEEWISQIEPNIFELVFTMAVLEHIHPSSEWIFAEMVRTTHHLITIEDEYTQSWRHKARDYGRVFSQLGMKQIGMGAIRGLSQKFVGRAFRKEMRKCD